MNVNLTPELERLIQDKVASGLYNNQSEVVREALKRYFALREYRALRAELVIEAEAKGIVTDEDVFNQVS